MLEVSIFIPAVVDVDPRELVRWWEELYDTPLILSGRGNMVLLCTPSKERALATLVERQWYLGEKPVVWMNGRDATFWDTVSQAIADLQEGGSGQPFRPAPFLIIETLYDIVSYCGLDEEKADKSSWLRQNANAIWHMAADNIELQPLIEEAAEFLASHSGFDLDALRWEEDEDDYDE